MEGFIFIIVSALIIESVWQVFKEALPNHNTLNFIGPLLLGISFAIITNQDLLSLSGIKSSVPIFGQVLTGILISRGSGFIHDLLDKLNNILQIE